MKDLLIRVREAQGSPLAMEEFLKAQEFFIKKTAGDVLGRPIGSSDDEWSVALQAFHEAVGAYREDKGAFISHARLVIRRRLIDHLRKEKRFDVEWAVDPLHFDGYLDDEDSGIGAAVLDKVTRREEHALTDEIEGITTEMAPFGITFMDLTTCSPRSSKTRQQAVIVLNFLLSRTDCREVIRFHGTLPITVILEETGVERKFLDKYRKYLITAMLILEGDYPGLQGYLHFIKEEKKGNER